MNQPDKTLMFAPLLFTRRKSLESSQLENYLHEQIPASARLDIGVKSCSRTQVELSAPLTTNLNHKNTAFGGSLSVIAILAGWSIVYLQLQDVRNEIVIQDSSISYLKPVNGDFTALSLYEESPDWLKFMKSFNRHGKGRISVVSNVYCNGKLAATHEGLYVAFNKTVA